MKGSGILKHGVITVAVIAAIVFAFSTGLTLATAQSAPEVYRKVNDKERADTPAAPMRFHIPGQPIPGNPGVEIDDQPEEKDESTPDEPDEEEKPLAQATFFGEIVEGKFVLIIDRSGSMTAVDGNGGPVEDYHGNIITNPNRMEIVQAEASKTLANLQEEDEFAIVTFGGNVTYYQSLVKASLENITAAINQVNSIIPMGATPAYKALEIACTYYGSELDSIYFLSDGEPNIGGGSEEILAIFPSWFAQLKEHGCELVCLHIGTVTAAQTFMQTLANQNDGVFKSIGH